VPSEIEKRCSECMREQRKQAKSPQAASIIRNSLAR
jgi:molybdopterin-biosynthesis enzyme MoeA-like protein